MSQAMPSMIEQQSIENLTQGHLTQLEIAKEKVKEAKAMLDAELFQNEEYRLIDEEQKAIAKRKKEIKKQILAENSAAASMEQTLKDYKSEVKGIQLTFSDYLGEYERKTGKDTIKDQYGYERTIIKKWTVGK